MPIRETTDADLSRRCRAGDPDAWRELVRRHSPMVYRLSARMLGPGADAEDACQETFLRVHRSFDSFDPTRPLQPWIARIAHNACLRRLGATSRTLMEPTEPDVLDEVRDVEQIDPERRTAQSQASQLLDVALADLTAQDRAIVLMRYREGLRLAEVAEATEMPVNTVKTRLHRARAKLRQLLAPLLK